MRPRLLDPRRSHKSLGRPSGPPVSRHLQERDGGILLESWLASLEDGGTLHSISRFFLDKNSGESD